MKLFSLYGSKIKKGNEEYLFWRNGLVIEDKGQLLFIRFNRDNQTIDLLNNVNDDNFSLQKEVVETLISSLQSSDNIDKNNLINEWMDSDSLDILITADGENFVNWKDLRRASTPTFYSRGGVYYRKDFRKFLDKNNMAKRIFISYSKDDLELVTSFIHSLTPLVLQGTIEEPWYCTYLSPGDEVHSKITSKMESADIVCFMCSNNFYKTKYIIDKELKPTLKRKKEGSSQLILPIIIDRTKWVSDNEEINLGNYAGFPYRGKPVSDFKNWDDAWYVTNWFLEQIIKTNQQPENKNDQWDEWDTKINDLASDIEDLLKRQIKGELNK